MNRLKVILQPSGIFLEKQRHRLIIAFAMFGFVWFCLFAFGAFKFGYFNLLHRLFLTACYALGSFLSCLFILFPIKKIFMPRYTARNLLLSGIGIIILTGTSNFLLTAVVFQWESPSLDTFLKNQVYTLIMASLVIPFFLLVQRNYFLFQTKSRMINPEHLTGNPLIRLDSEYKKGGMLLDANQLIFIQAMENYIDVHYLKNGQLSHAIVRNSLKRAESVLNFPFIRKCHRSFLVNLKFMSSPFNENGPLILSAGSKEFSIPVSRSYRNTIRDSIEAM